MLRPSKSAQVRQMDRTDRIRQNPYAARGRPDRHLDRHSFSRQNLKASGALPGAFYCRNNSRFGNYSVTNKHGVCLCYLVGFTPIDI
ncbi:hypothetical protein LC608_30795 [Nostoc sp. XA010]|uniref:hypothetical protein n=1 Tax=Nostoc sp. XA010 TaxID=2780407 RepID=UPI001E6506E9|nr:hypothetical protein [Nostoc sp. XA010]MCC5661269.1 hypothetical protein [Nostoc sp. XA010]